MSIGGASAEMPKYRCHKEVWALKILDVGTVPNGDGFITPADDEYASFPVPAAYMEKHRPQAGGYYVQYEDGYRSFSPAKAFEDGYTRI